MRGADKCGAYGGITRWGGRGGRGVVGMVQFVLRGTTRGRLAGGWAYRRVNKGKKTATAEQKQFTNKRLFDRKPPKQKGFAKQGKREGIVVPFRALDAFIDTILRDCGLTETKTDRDRVCCAYEREYAKQLRRWQESS